MAREEVDLMNVAKRTTVVVNIKNMEQFKIRIWLAVRLIKLAAIVGGLGAVSIEMVTEDG